MKISEVLPLIDDIEHLGPTSKESITRALTLVSEHLAEYNIIDDIADVYMNIDTVQDKILESYKDAELYMNIVFDIPAVAAYIDDKVVMEKQEIEENNLLDNMAYEVSKVRYLTFFNLFITSVNILIFAMI